MSGAEGLLADRPNRASGSHYYATDVDGGTLYYDDGNGWKKVEGASAGPSVTLGNFDADVSPLSDELHFPCDGTGPRPTFTWSSGSLPSWLTADGNITAPGLYSVVHKIRVGGGVTTPGLRAFFSGAFGNMREFVDLDGFALAGLPGNQFVALQDIQGLNAGDVPYQPDLYIALPTDATAVINTAIYIVRLAY